MIAYIFNLGEIKFALCRVIRDFKHHVLQWLMLMGAKTIKAIMTQVNTFIQLMFFFRRESQSFAFCSFSLNIKRDSG